ncbi:MAG: sugar phosphate isomerase/epimerase, partial [Gemmatimonadota bacterium]|nr:sugar phosphate isomerase/epimerase [Gemmatimonadota bacterium]
MIDRRRFVGLSVGLSVVGLSSPSFRLLAAAGPTCDGRLFEISLAQWSLHRMLQAGELNALAFPTFARRRFDLGAVEYVNTFFKHRVTDRAYLGELRSRAGDADVSSLLIMVDAEGRLGDPDANARTV